MTVRVELDAAELERTLSERLARVHRLPWELLEETGRLTVEYLQSFTSELRPGNRRAHPGRWADVSGDLARSYRYEVTSQGDEHRLEIINDSGHAEIVEAMDGFFVVRGVTDPGGPVHTALSKAIAQVAPEWELRR